ELGVPSAFSDVCYNSISDTLKLRDQDNITLNTCRDAAFVALANQGDNSSIIDVATCFFSAKGLSIHQGVSILDFLSYKKKEFMLKELIYFPFQTS
ncbi:hypothetical protein B296_00017713, partial [Ensete ventricosum]